MLIGASRWGNPATTAGFAAATAFLLLCTLTTALEIGGATVAASWARNLGALLLATGGGLACLRAARRTSGRRRRGWVAMAVACWSWAVGELLWTIHQNVLGMPSPYPSTADIGFLGFPVAALAAFAWLSPTPGHAVRRRMLDALLVGTSISLVGWLTVLDVVVAGSVATSVGITASLTFPVADTVALTMAVLTITQTRDRTVPWRLLGAGILVLTLSDAAFVVGATTGAELGGAVADWGWWAAFCLIGAAGALAAPETPEPAADRALTEGPGLLPYVLLAVAVAVVGVEYARGEPLDHVAGLLTALLVLLVLARQYATIRENQELARTVQSREVELHQLAFHDGLTGLANRALFLDRLQHALRLAERDAPPPSVVFLDLDGFKAVNDTLGHAMGDALLVAVAQRFSGALRASDTLARLGGDEFAVLVEQGADAVVVGRNLLRSLQAPFTLDGRTVSVSASIGVATADPGHGAAQGSNLVHRADVAMYAAKTAGKADVRQHSAGPPVEKRAAGRPPLLRAFTAALQDGTIRAAFQPVVDTATGRVTILEALARWTHEGSDVPPDVFVALGEEAGLSAALTELMLERSCAQLARWSRAVGHDRLCMAVNVSPTELGDTELPARISRLLTRHRLAPNQLTLEITESTLANRQDIAVDVLHALRVLGVRLALDDFGIGYSTLARLSSTPVGIVKIDRFFVADIDHDHRQRLFLEGLFDLTRRLGVLTVAEGVERPGQLAELRRLGCDLVQGYLIARPAGARELTPLVLGEQSLLPGTLATSAPGR